MRELLIIDAQQVAGGDLPMDVNANIPSAQTSVFGAALGDFLVTGDSMSIANSISANPAAWNAMMLNTITIGGFVIKPL